MSKNLQRMENSITIGYLPDSDVLVFRKIPESKVFLNTGDSIILSRATFIVLINYLVSKNIISPKVLEGILEEYNTE